MDFVSDSVFAVVSILIMFAFKRQFDLSLNDIGSLAINSINAITSNTGTLVKLLFLIVLSRAIRADLNTGLGLTNTTLDPSNPQIYLRVFISLFINIFAGMIFFFLKKTVS